MRAMRLDRAGPIATSRLSLVDAPVPEPGPGEVSIDVEACGVCRTDLHIAEGEVQAPLPRILGHQAAGRVAGVGDGVAGLAPGDAVGVGWMAAVDGRCAYCLSGRENLCAAARFTGRDRDGGYAEALTARAEWVFPLPPGFAVRDAAPLLCAGVIGYRSLRLAGVAPPEPDSPGRSVRRLGLFGFGASAHLAIQVALHWGWEVYAFTRGESGRRLALEMGARWAGEAHEDPGVLLDSAVTFAPAGELVPAALARVAPGGTVAINAIHMSPIPSMEYERIYGERVLRSVQNFTHRDAIELLALAAAMPIRSHVAEYALEDANAALQDVARGNVRGAAVLRVSR
ncbi:MAG TPA: zinc-dependent alcohol dehydrogenase family protein [Thermoanaerobaculia bacterium]|jgi:propanol-preferring alcohol dehydrogenase|nr:zinc-dependent alcohol dehydrogenase family protein [Thermoanaerobaculia bacterium]